MSELTTSFVVTSLRASYPLSKAKACIHTQSWRKEEWHLVLSGLLDPSPLSATISLSLFRKQQGHHI